MSSDESLIVDEPLSPSTIEQNPIIGHRYRMIKKLGSGSFGDIYLGENMNNSDKVAIKLERSNDRSAQLYNEYKFYQLIGDEIGFPKVYWFGQWESYNVIIMDMLGKNLEDVFEICNHDFSIKTIIYVALQLLERFEYLHSKSIAYRDVKPENFLLGLPGTANQNLVYVVDFGLSKEYIDPSTNRHISYREGKNLTGTARYMSINSHLGIEQSRRDDLEALGHVFIYFLRHGKLPWSGLKTNTLKERYRKIGEVKQNTPIDELCEGFPIEFGDYLLYCRNLEFAETPDYDMWKQKFVDLFHNLGYEDDNKYEWDDKLDD